MFQKQNEIAHRCDKALDILNCNDVLFEEVAKFANIRGAQVDAEQVRAEYAKQNWKNAEEIMTLALEAHTDNYLKGIRVEACDEHGPLGVVGVYEWYLESGVAWMENISRYPEAFFAERLGYVKLPKINALLGPRVREVCLKLGAGCVAASPYPKQRELLIQYYGWQPLGPEFTPATHKKLFSEQNTELEELVVLWFFVKEPTSPVVQNDF